MQDPKPFFKKSQEGFSLVKKSPEIAEKPCQLKI
jgi:hypothetical protein